MMKGPTNKSATNTKNHLRDDESIHSSVSLILRSGGEGLAGNKDKIQSRLGRDPTDNIGERQDYTAYQKRVFKLVWWICCLGWLMNLVDRLYSARTNQERVIGEGKKLRQGVDHLDSILITSALTGKDEQEKKSRTRNFIHRYYLNYPLETTERPLDIWNLVDELEDRLDDSLTRIDKRSFNRAHRNFKIRAEYLVSLLAADSANRHFYKEAKQATVTMIAFGGGIISTLGGAVPSTLPSNPKMSEVSTNITSGQMYTGIAITFSTGYITLLIERDKKAATNLDDALKYLEKEVAKIEERFSTWQAKYYPSKGEDEAIDEMFPIAQQLLELNYQWLEFKPAADPITNLYTAVSRLLVLEGKMETADMIKAKLVLYRAENGKKDVSMEAAIKDLAALYGHSIFIVNEDGFEGGEVYQFFNMESARPAKPQTSVRLEPIDSESKEAEEAGEENQLNMKQPEPAFAPFLFYTKGGDIFCPFLAPKGRSISAIEKDLEHLTISEIDKDDINETRSLLSRPG